MCDLIVVGLTGGYASGKSEVAKILRDLDIPVIDADEISREILAVGTPAWNDVKDTFGDDVFYQDGTLNRKRLGRIVFSDQFRRKELESITHPRIIEVIRRRLNELRDMQAALVVIDAPLLIETGLTSMVDSVWVVYAKEDTQIRRAMLRDRLSQREAELRVRSQMPLDDKVKWADIIIDNTGTIEDTREQVLNAVKKVMGRNGQ